VVSVRPQRARRIAEQVTDPELPMLTLHDLGILRDVHAEGSTIIVAVTPTYSGCPALAQLRADLVRRLRAGGFDEVEVRTVLDPPWSTDQITEHGRRVLAAHGIAPPGLAPARPNGPVPLTLGARPPAPACPRCGSPDTECVARFGSTACKALYRCRACLEPFEHLKAI
jgi:ring-1,2-phenylacetyl-CoA epoxidase subunit PaaD